MKKIALVSIAALAIAMPVVANAQTGTAMAPAGAMTATTDSTYTMADGKKVMVDSKGMAMLDGKQAPKGDWKAKDKMGKDVTVTVDDKGMATVK